MSEFRHVLDFIKEKKRVSSLRSHEYRMYTMKNLMIGYCIRALLYTKVDPEAKFLTVSNIYKIIVCGCQWPIIALHSLR